MDLALSQTHYPQVGLSLSILYGCDLSTNREVLKRVQTIRGESAHPLLMPGIIAEMELGRQIPIVEADIISVETRILELDTAITPHMEAPSPPVALQKRVDKRSAWLDLAYLRNSLVNWNTQLARMADHTDELERQIRDEKHSQVAQRAQMELTIPPTYVPYSLRSAKNTSATVGIYDSVCEKSSPGISGPEPGAHECFQVPDDPRLDDAEASIAKKPNETSAANTELVWTDKSQAEPKDSNMRHCKGVLGGESSEYHPSSFAGEDDEYVVKLVGDKIKRRLQYQQAEFEEMIRSCSMRLDGMAMATQWVRALV
jgi:hypothetical protein